MAKKSMIADVLGWTPPPVTKEEALSPYTPYAWQRDGFDGKGGGEPPSEYDLDRIVYPHDAGPIEEAQDRMSQDRRNQTEVYRDEALQRSRNFDITEGNFTGADPGPPSAFGPSNEKKGE